MVFPHDDEKHSLPSWGKTRRRRRSRSISCGADERHFLPPRRPWGLFSPSSFSLLLVLVPLLALPVSATTTTTTPSPLTQTYSLRARLAFYVATYMRDCTLAQCSHSRECYDFSDAYDNGNTYSPWTPTVTALATEQKPHPHSYCPVRGPGYWMAKATATTFPRTVAFREETDADLQNWNAP